MNESLWEQALEATEKALHAMGEKGKHIHVQAVNAVADALDEVRREQYLNEEKTYDFPTYEEEELADEAWREHQREASE